MSEFDASFFDRVYDRRGTYSIKYMQSKVMKNDFKDCIPMWIADMDFKSPPAVQEALRNYTDFGIFGYAFLQNELKAPIMDWYWRRQGFSMSAPWILVMPSVMFSIACAITALTNKHDPVLILEPVYHHFAGCIRDNERTVVSVSLMRVGERYTIDFIALEKAIIKSQVKVLLFCSPHNPVGRVWSKDELLQVANLAEKYGLTVISDEIHSDFVWKGKHVPFMSVSEYAKNNSITCIAPTKSFNLAGLHGSAIVCANQELRKKIKAKAMATCGFMTATPGLLAMQAVYTKGEPWFEGVYAYIKKNIGIVEDAFKGTIVKVTPAEGTYLLWLDFSAAPFSKTENLMRYVLDNANVWLNDGEDFGASGKGFLRMNVACPRSILNKALLQIKTIL